MQPGALTRGLDLTQLLTLKRVVALGSFSAAATELGYVQSAVSSQIAALERATGHRLLERTRGTRQAHITPAGRVLLDRAEEIFAALRSLEDDLAAVGGTRPVRVAATAAAARGILPALLRRLADQALAVEVLEAPRGAAAQRLVTDGAADVAFTGGPVDPALRAVEITRDPFRLVVGGGAARGPLSSLSGRVLYALPATQAQAEVEDALRLHGFRPAQVCRLEDPSLVDALGAAGPGVGLLPRLACDSEPDVVVALDAYHPGQPIYAVWAPTAAAELHERVASVARDALAA
ncbi:MAG TPA: LysR family transcriptional regulator [Gaiellaceae bacterium]